MKCFTELLKQTFGERIYFAGLQGSYGRGEATGSSDIDVVVILDKLTAVGLKTYSDMKLLCFLKELTVAFEKTNYTGFMFCI